MQAKILYGRRCQICGYATFSEIRKCNGITAPEIEMLIIFNEDKYKEFKKSGKKPSDFCKEKLKMTDKVYRIQATQQHFDVFWVG